MFQFVEHIVDDLHPILNHFPIALLVVSFVLAFAAGKWPKLRQTEWWLFAGGSLTTLPAAISGIIAHEAYEHLPVHKIIETHGLPANLGPYRSRHNRLFAIPSVRPLSMALLPYFRPWTILLFFRHSGPCPLPFHGRVFRP